MEHRELKFRYWDGNKMYSNIGVHPHQATAYWVDKDSGYKSEDDEGALLMCSGLAKFPIMQYTGLTDKNGTEIYEHDIVKTVTDKPMVVSWNQKLASFCLDREGWAFSHFFGESCDPKDCEVIGNIYEHKNLLK
jgi:uncharacterized phage protein (TIGR01671 family)